MIAARRVRDRAVSDRLSVALPQACPRVFLSGVTAASERVAGELRGLAKQLAGAKVER